MTLAQEVAVTAAAEGAYLLHGCLAQRLNQGMGSLRGVLLTEQRQEAQGQLVRSLDTFAWCIFTYFFP